MGKSGPRTRKRSAFVLLFWYKKVAEQEKRISEIEMRLGIKPLEDPST